MNNAMPDPILVTSLCESLKQLKRDLSHQYTAEASICYHLSEHWHYKETSQGDDLLRHLFRTWPEGSGNIWYPVPAPEGATNGPEAAFYQYAGFTGRWTGTYGESRRRLLDWMIQTLEQYSARLGQQK